ncbi:13198_t:CDS:2, partial [Dentiscutata heterogama]
ERIEYSNLCATLITNRYKRAFIQIIVYLAIESFIIASIILSAQSLDSLYITLFGVTCGVGIYPDSGWLCIRELGDEASPFGERWMLFTVGFMTTLLFVVPMTWMRLSNNAKIQIASFLTIIFVIFAWIVALTLHGLEPKRIPIIGENQSQAVGIILFNYAFIVTVPSLANELEEDGSIRKIVYTSIAISTFGYISLGILGAMAFDLDLSTNIIASIRQSELRNNILGFSTYLFPFILLISVPINVIVIRYNLVRTGFCGGKKWHGVEEIIHVKRTKRFRAFFPE